MFKRKYLKQFSSSTEFISQNLRQLVQGFMSYDCTYKETDIEIMKRRKVNTEDPAPPPLPFLFPVLFNLELCDELIQLIFWHLWQSIASVEIIPKQSGGKMNWFEGQGGFVSGILLDFDVKFYSIFKVIPPPSSSSQGGCSWNVLTQATKKTNVFKCARFNTV